MWVRHKPLASRYGVVDIKDENLLEAIYNSFGFQSERQLQQAEETLLRAIEEQAKPVTQKPFDNL